MSKINLESAENNMDKISRTLAELNQLVESKKEEIEQNLSKFNELLSSNRKKSEQLINEQNSEEALKTELQSKLDQLSNELDELTHQRSVLEAEIASKQKDLEALANLILEKEKKKTELQLTVESNQQKLDTINRKIEEYEALIEATKEETEANRKIKEQEIIELEEQYQTTVSRVKALKYLVKKNLINLPEVQVIRSLSAPGMDSEQNIRKMSGVSDQLIRKILLDLDSKGIISFDPLTGKIQVLTTIDI